MSSEPCWECGPRVEASVWDVPGGWMMGRSSSSSPVAAALAGVRCLIGGVLSVASDEETDLAGSSWFAELAGLVGRMIDAGSMSLR